jgi:asparagine synthase (glutamine-hydrolysing)
MLESMRHENYYVGGQLINRDVGLCLGWLSHPRALGECMPLVSPDKQIVLVIIGEHFAHSRAIVPPSRNSSVEDEAQDLIRLYQESEDKFLNYLNGWFCGVAVDLRLGKVTLFNDRYGMHRIYVHEGEEEFLFASEAKALLRVRPVLRAIEPQSLAQYLQSNCVMGNKTLFKGISLLPAASSWVFAGRAAPQKRAYFDFSSWEQQPILGSEAFHHRFAEVVSRLFPRYMEDTQRVALSLTAGLDTRVILATKEPDRSLPCYTFGGLWGETFDIRAARKLARACHQSHETIKVNETFLRDFPGYARKSVYISDGTHDVLGAHDVYFNQVARSIAPIRLTGKFGSEVVRTRRLIPSGDFPRRLVQPGLASMLDEAPRYSQVSQKSHPLSRMVSEEIPWYEYGRVSVEQSQVILRTPYMDNELVKLMYQAEPGLRASRDLQARYVKEKRPKLSDVPTNMGRVRENGGLMGKIAYSMYWALFKAEFIYLYATPHWLTWLDRKLGKLGPERIIAGRQKFEGYRIWLKTHLADFVRDVLLSPGAYCTAFFDKAWLTKVVMRHTAGTHNYLNEINKLLTVELISSSLFAPEIPQLTTTSVSVGPTPSRKV